MIVKPVGASSTQSVVKGKLTILKDFISIINIFMRIITHTHTHTHRVIAKNEMGGECDTYGGEER